MIVFSLEQKRFHLQCFEVYSLQCRRPGTAAPSPDASPVRRGAKLKNYGNAYVWGVSWLSC